MTETETTTAGPSPRLAAVFKLAAMGSVALLVGYGLGRGLQRPAAPDPSLAAATFPSEAGWEMPSILFERAPEFTMRLLGDGRPASLGDFAGRPVVVNFWATWCPPCRMEMPWLQAAHVKYADQGLVVLAVNAGERTEPELVESTIAEFVDLMGLTFPVLVGENTYDVQSDYMVWGLPATYLIDRRGIVVDEVTGMFDGEADLERRLAAILD